MNTQSIYAVLFEDNPGTDHLRQHHMQEHLAFLAAHADAVSAAGPLVDATTDDPAGGLWLVKADSPESVESLVREDPFYPTGLRKSVRILSWRQVFTA